MIKTICPFCEQDYVWQVTISNLGNDSQIYFMCFECDTMWNENEEIGNNSGLYFKTFMEQQGKIPDWTKITQIKIHSSDESKNS